MTATVKYLRKIKTKFSKTEIPKSLIYEEIDGKPLYYKGFIEVMNQLKSYEEIMGQSDIQGILHGIINAFLIENIDKTKFFLIGNEQGIHLERKSNLSSDIAIYDKVALQSQPLKGKYLTIPPLSVIEIDIQGDTNDFGISEMDYYSSKTKKLLDFGVKEVIWFFSKPKQVYIAKSNQDWTISDWNKDISILENYTFSLGKQLEKEGWKI
jgi:Uma2 family endonuclease